MTESDNNPDNKNDNETLAQRSKRLEQEASEMIRQAEAAKQANMTHDSDTPDPLAPEPIAPSEGSAQDTTGQEDLSEDLGNVEDLYAQNDPIDFSSDAIADVAANAALQAELADAKDKMIRAVAEAENTRRRAAKEREDARKYSISGFSKDLLSVSDNLRRALDAIPAELLEREEQLKNLVSGIEATERELLRAFEKNGIKKLIPVTDGDGEVFDPNKHEVMFEIPGTGKPAGTVVQVMEPGYILHDRLLKPARVGVAKDDGSNPPPETTHIDTQA